MTVEQLALAALIGLAGWRVARLVAKDTVTDPFRTALGRWAWNDGTQSYRSPTRAFAWNLVTCTFCLSVWFVALAWFVYAQRWPGWSDLVVIGGGAGVAALCATRDG